MGYAMLPEVLIQTCNLGKLRLVVD